MSKEDKRYLVGKKGYEDINRAVHDAKDGQTIVDRVTGQVYTVRKGK